MKIMAEGSVLTINKVEPSLDWRSDQLEGKARRKKKNDSVRCNGKTENKLIITGEFVCVDRVFPVNQRGATGTRTI